MIAIQRWRGHVDRSGAQKVDKNLDYKTITKQVESVHYTTKEI